MLLWQNFFFSEGPFGLWQKFFSSLWQKLFFSLTEMCFFDGNLVSVMETCFMEEFLSYERNCCLTETVFFGINFFSLTGIGFCHGKLFCYSNLVMWRKLFTSKMLFLANICDFNGKISSLEKWDFPLSRIVKIITLWSPARGGFNTSNAAKGHIWL